MQACVSGKAQGSQALALSHLTHTTHTAGTQGSPYLLSPGLRVFLLLLSCRCDKLIKQGLSIFHLFNCLEPRVFSMLGCKFTKSSSATKWQVNSFGRAVWAVRQVQQGGTSSAAIHARAQVTKTQKANPTVSLQSCWTKELHKKSQHSHKRCLSETYKGGLVCSDTATCRRGRCRERLQCNQGEETKKKNLSCLHNSSFLFCGLAVQPPVCPGISQL